MASQPSARRFDYGSGRSQYAVLETPPSGEPFAVVVLLHGGFWRAGFNRTLMNPLAHDLLVHGEQDTTVAPWMSPDYAAAATAAGDDVTLALTADEAHFEHIRPPSAAWDAVVAWLERFR